MMLLRYFFQLLAKLRNPCPWSRAFIINLPTLSWNRRSRTWVQMSSTPVRVIVTTEVKYLR